MSGEITALIVAAGMGERLGAGGPKAFVELSGRPMLEWSIDALTPVAQTIVVALPPGETKGSDPFVSVEGGATRSESVRNALAAAPPSELVLVHDAARPLVTRELTEAVIAGVGDADGAVAAAPVAETVKRVEGAVVAETLDRSSLWAIQTPQVFRREALERALDVPTEVLAAATDDASLVERAGGTIRIVEAPRENLKVTTPLDLRVAEALLAERG